MIRINPLPRWLGVAAVAVVALATPAAADPAKVVVSTEWLAANLANPKVRVLDVSIDTGLFAQGHVPGAVRISWHDDLVDTVRRDIASRTKIEELLSQAGVAPDGTVVIYGDFNNWFAAWAAWVFDVYGVADVRLLDGGRKKWQAEGRPLATEAVRHARTTVTLKEANAAIRARLADVLAVAEGRDKATRLIDIRSPDEYAGRIFAPAGVPELAIRAGHIPGAVNVPWGEAVNADGTFKSVDELRALYAKVGVDGSQPVIVYCRIGERSSHTWFVLSKLLGYRTLQYDGSWTEYGNAVGVPIANLAGTVWGQR
jgi:thiosulfate/3-mercaptopyruvate sulfurtransferase